MREDHRRQLHHLPFRELLPPPHSAQWDFAKAFLGSERIGQLLLARPNVRHVFCGHSHLPMDVNIGEIRAGKHRQRIPVENISDAGCGLRSVAAGRLQPAEPGR